MPRGDWRQDKGSSLLFVFSPRPGLAALLMDWALCYSEGDCSQSTIKVQNKTNRKPTRKSLLSPAEVRPKL